MNCAKNNVVCDGYEPKQPWRSGKQKALQLYAVPPLLPNISPAGVENDIDHKFLAHFVEQLGGRLSLTDKSNPFREFILPMADSNLGLMHSVLFLSGTCVIASSPGVSDEVVARRAHHQVRAISFLTAGGPPLPNNFDFNGGPLQEETANDSRRITAGTELGPTKAPQSPSDALMPTRTPLAPYLTTDPSIAQTLILCLETVADGNTYGDYRVRILKLFAPNSQVTATDRRFSTTSML